MHGTDAAYYARVARWSATEKYRGEIESVCATLALARGARVLDIGCGTGATLRFLSVAGYLPFGVERGVAFGPRALPPGPVARADGALLPFADGTFDAALLVHVYAHVTRPDAALREAARVLRPGGRLAILTPNAVHLAPYRVWPFRDPSYVPDPTVERHVRMAELVAQVASAGLVVTVRRRIGRGALGLNVAPLRERLLVVAERPLRPASG